jgi:hypothetical protein
MLYLVVFVAIVAISVSAFAASTTVTVTNNAGYQGVYVNDNGYFTVTANYYVVNTAQGASTPPLAWATGTGYYNALTAGNWEIAFVVTVQAGATASHTYTMTVASTAASGTVSQLFGAGFTFTTAATITAGQFITIIYDTGSQTWNAPTAITIAIA